MVEQTTFFILLSLIFFSYYISKNKAKSLQKSSAIKLDSMASYYGYFSVICSVLPAFILLAIWSFLESGIITQMAVYNFPEINNLPKDELNITLSKINNIIQSDNLNENSYGNIYLQVAELIKQYQVTNIYLKTM